MKKVIFTLFFGCVAFLSNTQVSAQSYCDPCCYDWTGLYIGVNGGYGWDKTQYRFTPRGTGFGMDNLFAPNETGGSFRQKVNGGILGVHVGFNKQWCSFVVGLEGAFEGSWMEGKSRDVFAPVTPPSVTYKTNFDWFATLTPRLGYAWDNILLYGKGGLAALHVESKLFSSAILDGSTFKQTQDHVGWTVGAGIEYSWCRNWIVGVEYDYYRLPQRKYGGVVTPNEGWPLEYTLRPSFNTVLVRISYKFW